jgi:hypothetical protein
MTDKKYGSAALFARAASAISYKKAKPGVLQEGAWADMLLVEGTHRCTLAAARMLRRLR